MKKWAGESANLPFKEWFQKFLIENQKLEKEDEF